MNPKYNSIHQDSFREVQGARGLQGTLPSYILVVFILLKISWKQEYVKLRAAERSRCEQQMLFPLMLHLSLKRLPRKV